MTYTKPFAELNRTSAEIAGGKGASLGEMLNAGIPVPDGYVVLSDTFDHFIHKTDLIEEIDAILDNVDHKVIHTVEQASEKIQGLILSREMPEDIKNEIIFSFKNLDAQFVAVRSSATAEDGADHAWAGQLESYLNTTEDTLLEKVQECWASLFTPRAIFYRFEKGLHSTKISVAVVVQKMVASEVSGIAFSVHPVTEDYNQLIIEAGFGLGEAIVSGSVTPDSYVVEKEPRRIIDINISTQERQILRKEGGGNEWVNIPEPKASSQVLTEEQILELGIIIMRIENHYGFPCDIEWAFEKGKFYIVQSRPITTLSLKKPPTSIRFIKEYTRDYTYMIEEGWYDVILNKFVRYDGEQTPYVPPVLFHMNDGVVEVWEHAQATPWILDTLQSNIQADISFLPGMLNQHERELVDIKRYWDKKFVTSKEDLKEFVQKVYEYMYAFDFMYYAGVDERTPEDIRARALKMRDADHYFGTSDDMIRLSLQKIYPELKGLETTILFSEIDNPPSREILQARKNSSILVGSEVFIGTLKEYQVQHTGYIFEQEPLPPDSTIINGQIGNRGFAKGKVRILKRKEQIDEMKEGEVIVSAMTTPEFVPAMKKASAIITDEGGITCHAAIVARELNKPCVIGTKFATQILKDGDEVEVDADNGIVRILNSNTTETDLHYFDNLVFQASRPQTMQRDEFIQYLYGSYKQPNFRLVTTPLEGAQRGLWVDSEYEKSFYAQLLDGVSTEAGFEKNKQEYLDLQTHYAELTARLHRTDFTKSELIQLFADYEKASAMLGNPAWTPFTIEKILDAQFAAGLQSKYPNDFESLYGAVSDPTELTDYQKMYSEIYESVFNNADTTIASQELARKYYWSSEYSYIEPLLTAEHFVSEIKKFSPTTAQEEYNKLQHIPIANKEKFDQALAKITDPVLNLQARVINYYVYIRTDRVDHIRRLMAPFRTVYEQVASYLKADTGVAWTREHVVKLLTEEIITYLEKGMAPNLDEVIERVNHYIYISDKDGTRLITDPSNVTEIATYIKNQHKKGDTITGKVAYKGVVQGKASLIYSKDDLAKVTNESILVARTTMIEYTPAMERALAFVTAEGGITSHAAIVARELKKPCIVGTVNCMDLIQDGDTIEVDADKGVVRILSKKNEDSQAKDIVLFDGKEWEAKVTRNLSLWHQYIANQGNYFNNVDYGIDTPLESLFITANGTNTTIFFYESNFGIYVNRILEYIKEKENILNIKKVCHEKANNLVEAVDRCLLDISKENFNLFIQACQELCPALTLTNTIGRAGTVVLEKKLQQAGYTEGETSDLIGIVTYPSEHTPLYQSQHELYEIAATIQKKKISEDEINQELQKWIMSHGYIPVNFCEEPWSLEDAQKQLNELLEKDCTLKLEEMEKDHQARVENMRTTIKKLDHEISTLAYALQEATYLNEFRKNVFSLVSLKYRPIFDHIVKLGGSTNWRDGFYLLPGEMSALLDGEKLQVKDIVDSRKIAGFYMDTNGVCHNLNSEVQDEFSKHIHGLHNVTSNPNNQTIKEIKGFSANKGKIQGTARLIMSTKDFGKLNRGDILVTTMTSVDFVPVMERAGAFVTNEGGITSHASIVAREMNKPCIIGTKIATKTIPDGAFVEVDADKGLVTIINK